MRKQREQKREWAMDGNVGDLAGVLGGIEKEGRRPEVEGSEKAHHTGDSQQKHKTLYLIVLECGHANIK